MECEHKWHFVSARDDAKKVGKSFIATVISRWVCENCGKMKTIEYNGEDHE